MSTSKTKKLQPFTQRRIAALHEVHRVTERWDTKCEMSGEIKSSALLGHITDSQLKGLSPDIDGEFTLGGVEYIAFPATLELLEIVEL